MITLIEWRDRRWSMIVFINIRLRGSKPDDFDSVTIMCGHIEGNGDDISKFILSTKISSRRVMYQISSSHAKYRYKFGDRTLFVEFEYKCSNLTDTILTWCIIFIPCIPQRYTLQHWSSWNGEVWSIVHGDGKGIQIFWKVHNYLSLSQCAMNRHIECLSYQ